MHCCIMIWVFSICFLPIFCRAMQFSSLPSIVERLKGWLRKFMENIKTERSFFLNYAGEIKVISFASGKRIRKAYNGRTKVKLFTKKCLSIPQRFSCRNQWAFKKSDNILCALEVLNVDNLKACVCYFLLNFNFFTKW